MEKERLDNLVQRQAGVSRSKAQGMILTGLVQDAQGTILKKPGLRLPVDTPLRLEASPRFVSRGGDKLEAAFLAFGLDVQGLVTADIGASTGGFTDCLLQHGAARVYAIDVGYGQLAWELRQDPRVVVLERCNIRTLDPALIPEPPVFFTVDCSFISLRLVLPAVLKMVAPGARGVALIKPQFEAGRENIARGGVVKDEAIREQVVEEVCNAARELGFQEIEVIPSPLLGPAGNKEFLAYLHRYSR